MNPIFFSEIKKNVVIDPFEIKELKTSSRYNNSWYIIDSIDDKSYRFPCSLRPLIRKLESSNLHPGDKIELHIHPLKKDDELIEALKISGYTYYHSLYFIYVYGDKDKKNIRGIFSSLDEIFPEEREEFFKYFQNHWSKDNLKKLFGRDNIEKEWDDALVRARKEATSVTKNFKDCFQHLIDENLNILFGASHDMACGKYHSLNTGECNIDESETLFAIPTEDLKKIVEGHYVNNNKDLWRIEIDNNNEENLKKYGFFESSLNAYQFAYPLSRLPIILWVRIEDRKQNGNINSYSFIFQDENVDTDIFERYGIDFIRYIMTLKSEVHEAILEDTRHQATKTALATIACRNMSHNLGSHCLYYTEKDIIEIGKKSESNADTLTSWGALLEIYKQLTLKKLYGDFQHDAKAKTPEIKKIIKDLYSKYKSTILSNIPPTQLLNTVLTPNKYDINWIPLILQMNEINEAFPGVAHIIDLCKDRMNYIAAFVEDNKYPPMPVMLTLILKNLLIDDKKFNAKTAPNYYLGNIVRSEGYTRNKWEINITFNVIPESEDISQNNIELSLPGGYLSIHAFLNIIENFVRNSAKYQTNGKRKDLIFTLRYKIQNGHVLFKLSDNKPDGEESCNKINSILNNLMFLNDDDSLNRESKGLKEIILSYLWIISSCYKKSIGDVIYDWDRGGKNLNRLSQFIQSITGGKEIFGFKVIDPKDGLVTITRNKEIRNSKDLYNLCLTFSVPLHIEEYHLKTDTSESLDSIPSCDLVVLDSSCPDLSQTYLYKHIPRISCREKGEVEQKPNINLIKAINSRLRINISDYSMSVGRDYNEGQPTIIFEGHANIKGLLGSELKNIHKDKVYYDSISGGNYTKTLEQRISSGYKNGTFTDSSAARLSLLIKESAITRITLIDERLFSSIKKWINIDSIDDNEEITIVGSQEESSLRNLRILNYIEGQEKVNPLAIPVNGFEILRGNEFRQIGPLKNSPNATHFLSIHLGIIEKMLNNSKFLEDEEFCGPKYGNPMSPDRVKRLMQKIKGVFFPENCVPFICIHSGRGGLSKELQNTELGSYPFIPYITMEHLFNDSKFLLSAMFYSQTYINTK